MPKKQRPTYLQRKAVKRLIINNGNVSKSMVEAGYSPASAKNPSLLTQSDGFKALCDQYNLTDELILTALVEDIKLKPQNRKPELELGAKMRGMLVDRSEVQHSGIIQEMPQEDLDKILKLYGNNQQERAGETGDG